MSELKIIKLLLIDFDGVIMGETLFPQIVVLLDDLKLRGFRMSVVSHNSFARFFCERYDIDSYFDYIVGDPPVDYDKPTKAGMINGVLDSYKSDGVNVKEECVVFIDDRVDVISFTKAELPKINYIQVDGIIGMTTSDLSGLPDFSV